MPAGDVDGASVLDTQTTSCRECHVIMTRTEQQWVGDVCVCGPAGGAAIAPAAFVWRQSHPALVQSCQKSERDAFWPLPIIPSVLFPPPYCRYRSTFRILFPSFSLLLLLLPYVPGCMSQSGNPESAWGLGCCVHQLRVVKSWLHLQQSSAAQF